MIPQEVYNEFRQALEVKWELYFLMISFCKGGTIYNKALTMHKINKSSVYRLKRIIRAYRKRTCESCKQMIDYESCTILNASMERIDNFYCSEWQGKETTK